MNRFLCTSLVFGLMFFSSCAAEEEDSPDLSNSTSNAAQENAFEKTEESQEDTQQDTEQNDQPSTEANPEECAPNEGWSPDTGGCEPCSHLDPHPDEACACGYTWTQNPEPHCAHRNDHYVCETCAEEGPDDWRCEDANENTVSPEFNSACEGNLGCSYLGVTCGECACTLCGDETCLLAICDDGGAPECDTGDPDAGW